MLDLMQISLYLLAWFIKSSNNSSKCQTSTHMFSEASRGKARGLKNLDHICSFHEQRNGNVHLKHNATHCQTECRTSLLRLQWHLPSDIPFHFLLWFYINVFGLLNWILRLTHLISLFGRFPKDMQNNIVTIKCLTCNHL